MQTSALWFSQANNAEIKQHQIAAQGYYECFVEARYSLVSLGTEKLVFQGKVPPELHEEMRCPNMEGSFSFPIKYGYSLVGIVTDGPEKILGKQVHVLHPHQDKFFIPQEEVYVIPDGITLPRATLASNLETAVNAVWDSRTAIGDKVLVVGFGIIGSLIARVLSMMPEVQVEIAETNPAQQKLAKAIGFSVVEDPSELKNSYDVAFHTSGSAEGLQTAIDAVAFEGRIVELSWYGEKSVSLSLGGSFHSMRKELVSSQVSHIAYSQRSRWNNLRRKKLVFDLLKNNVFDLHLTHCIEFSKLSNFFNQQLNQQHQRLGCLVKF